MRSSDLAIILISGLVLVCILYIVGSQNGIENNLKWQEVILYVILTLIVINVSLCSGNKLIGLIKNKTSIKSVRWGALLFHLSLILIFAGGLYGRLTRFEGYVELGEGQEFIEGHNSYLTLTEGPFFGEKHGGFLLQLDKVFAFTDYRDRTKDYASHIKVFEDGKTKLTTTIKPNKPISYNGFSVYQSKYFGNALLFKFIDKEGRENAGYVNLSLSDKEKQDETSDFVLPGTKTKVMLTLHKIDSKEKMVPHNSDFQSGNFFLTLSINGKRLKERVFPGESMDIETGTLSLLDIKKWSGLTIVKDLSIYPVFMGFVTGIIGLVWMYAR